MTAEQRKWYLAGANDMEAGRLVRHGPLLVAESKPPALTAEEAQWQLDAQATAIRTVEGLPADVRVKYEGPWWDGIRKLRLIANGENQ